MAKEVARARDHAGARRRRVGEPDGGTDARHDLGWDTLGHGRGAEQDQEPPAAARARAHATGKKCYPLRTFRGLPLALSNRLFLTLFRHDLQMCPCVTWCQGLTVTQGACRRPPFVAGVCDGSRRSGCRPDLDTPAGRVFGAGRYLHIRHVRDGSRASPEARRSKQRDAGATGVAWPVLGHAAARGAGAGTPAEKGRGSGRGEEPK